MTEDEPAAAREARRSRARRPVLLIAGTVLLLGLAAAIVLMLLRSDDNGPVIRADKAVVVSSKQLRSFAASLNHPVYWAGEMTGTRFELTKTSKDHVFVRYLPGGVAAGDKRPQFTTVATYLVPHAYQLTLDRAKRANAMQQKGPGGGLVIIYRQRTSSVYLTYPGSDYLVEVHDPDAAKARQLVLSGRVGALR